MNHNSVGTWFVLDEVLELSGEIFSDKSWETASDSNDTVFCVFCSWVSSTTSFSIHVLSSSPLSSFSSNEESKDSKIF